MIFEIVICILVILYIINEYLKTILDYVVYMKENEIEPMPDSAKRLYS
jgi:hypothetical protein